MKGERRVNAVYASIDCSGLVRRGRARRVAPAARDGDGEYPPAGGWRRRGSGDFSLPDESLAAGARRQAPCDPNEGTIWQIGTR
jgi:hypothetical protein